MNPQQVDYRILNFFLSNEDSGLQIQPAVNFSIAGLKNSSKPEPCKQCTGPCLNKLLDGSVCMLFY